MNLKEYQKFALTTAIYPKIYVVKDPTEDQLKRCSIAGVVLQDVSWIYPLIGLFGEVGEMANKLKKVIRDNNFEISIDRHKDIVDEDGDISWYKVILEHELLIDPNLSLEQNIDKLSQRKEKKTISGSGDHR